MPANHSLWPNDYEMILPPRPESGEHDPERAIERGKPRPRSILSIDSELLTEGKLDDRLFLATSEEGEDAAKDRNREDDQRPHESRMVRDRMAQNESESRN